MRMLLAISALVLTGAIAAAGNAAPTLPPGSGLDLLKAKCANCHPIAQIVQGPPKTAQKWAQTVRKMVDRGAEITPAEVKAINAYLAQHLSATSGN